MRFVASIGQVAAAILSGITTLDQVITAMRAGNARIHREDGQDATPEELSGLVAEITAKSGRGGDLAAGRVAGRHPGP